MKEGDMWRWIGAVVVIVGLSLTATASVPDSLALTPEIPVQELSRAKMTSQKQAKPFVPVPRKAVLYSIIPGGGQFYNRKYWKLPIVAGIYTGCYYAITWNHSNMVDYANAYRDVKGDAPMENRSWVDFIPSNAKPEDYVTNSSFHNNLRRGRDFYRRNRDLSVIISVAAYALLMIDAYVDAELYAFDISPNVSFSYQPVVTMPSVGSPSPSYGMQVAMTF